MRPILFNHIPRTGGTTLRIILNRVYGPERVYHIKSTDIASSLDEFREFGEKTRVGFRVVAGHGAELFSDDLDHPFRIAILREPLSLFISQYYFLRKSRKSNFYEEVRALASIEDYPDYALEKGQDNLLTRYLSGSVHFLADPGIPIPAMEERGYELLEKAKVRMEGYDALLDLASFDKGVFALSRKLGWQGIPIFRPSNRVLNKPGKREIPSSFKERLRRVLRFDIDLYEHFLRKKMEVAHAVDHSAPSYLLYRSRQSLLNATAFLLRKS